MNIAVNPSMRQAVIDAPAVFALGEALPINVTGLLSPHLATLKLALYGIDGTPLALCSSFGAGDGVWTGTLDTRTTAAVTVFTGKRPDERVPVIVALGDDTRLWFTTGAEMANNPLRGTPAAPDPAMRYLTRQDFSDLPDITEDMTLDAVYDRLRRVIEGLRGS